MGKCIVTVDLIGGIKWSGKGLTFNYLKFIVLPFNHTYVQLRTVVQTIHFKINNSCDQRGSKSGNSFTKLFTAGMSQTEAKVCAIGWFHQEPTMSICTTGLRYFLAMIFS